MRAFVSQACKVAPLLIDDVDTDQIIPARFLKVTEKAGLGIKLFYDWRYGEGGAPRPEFVLERPEVKGATALLAGRNFGCGSSREHAPWALADWGFRVILALSFGDIFRNNALKNGLLPVVLEPEAHAELAAAATGSAGLPEVMIKLEEQHVLLPSGRAVSFDIDPFAKRCLLQGVDELGYLMSFADRIAAYEARQ